MIIREIKWNAINLDINFYKAFIQGLNRQGKSNKAVHSEKRVGERLSRVILNLGMLSEVIYNHANARSRN